MHVSMSTCGVECIACELGDLSHVLSRTLGVFPPVWRCRKMIKCGFLRSTLLLPVSVWRNLLKYEDTMAMHDWARKEMGRVRLIAEKQ